MIRLSSIPRATTALRINLATDLAAHQAGHQNDQTNRQRAPADTEQFAQVAVGGFGAMAEIISEGLADSRRLRFCRFFRGRFHHYAERRRVRQFARLADHEFVGMRIEIPLAER